MEDRTEYLKLQRRNDESRDRKTAIFDVYHRSIGQIKSLINSNSLACKMKGVTGAYAIRTGQGQVNLDYVRIVNGKKFPQIWTSRHEELVEKTLLRANVDYDKGCLNMSIDDALVNNPKYIDLSSIIEREVRHRKPKYKKR